MPTMTAFQKSPWLGTTQFLVLLVVLQCVGQTTTKTTTATATTQTTDCRVHDLTGQTDIVFLIDRSTSVGNGSFQKMKAFAKDILNKYTIVSPDHTRVTVISFGSYVTEDINFINASHTEVPVIYECEFFHEHGPFQTQVRYQGHSNSKKDDIELLCKYCIHCHK